MAVNIKHGNVQGLQVSKEVDRTSPVRPVLKIKSPGSPLGYKIINVESYDEQNMTKISDPFLPPTDVRKISQDVTQLEQFNSDYISESEGGKKNDFKKMTGPELRKYAKKHDIDISGDVSVPEIRKTIIDYEKELEEEED